MNVKPGKDFEVTILHQQLQNFSEQVFLEAAPQRKLQVADGKVAVVSHRARAKQPDRSGTH